MKFLPNESHILCIDISFFKTLTTAVKHSSFSHTLIMMLIIEFITSQHLGWNLFLVSLFMEEQFLNNPLRWIPSKTAVFAMICHLFFYILWFLFFRFCECVYVTSDFGFTITKFQFFNYFFKHTLIWFQLVYTGVFSEIMDIFWHLVYRTKQDNENRMIFWNSVQFRILPIQVPLDAVNE